MRIIIWVAAFIGLSGWVSSAQAQHVIVLKNGRQITVQSYREEGSMIKFVGLGGEIGIPKDQIQAILKAGQTDRTGLSISEMETSSRQSAPAVQKPTPSSTRDVTQPPSSAETKPSVDPEEVKEYQTRLAEVSQQLEAAKQQYFDATQGGGTASNVSKEGIRSWAMDFASRIHDSQKTPGGGGPSSTPPTPPYAPNYTAKERELSDLRSQIDRLQKERAALIEEMKSKNIPTGPF
ncbi:MAG TPA: hypothetical protein VGK77_23310 [Candidatus Binatia bacterium]|jgi:hypothetical protein